MDLTVVIIGAIVMLLAWGFVARPNGPDPEEIEDAPQVIVEGGCGLLVVGVAALAVVGFILLN